MNGARSSAFLTAPVLALSLAWPAGLNTEQHRLQRLVDTLREEHNLPGISVALGKGTAPPIFAAAGFANLDGKVPVTPETSFFIGSVSKNLFATVALAMADQERLSLDDKLSKFVEWPRGDDVILRMLLNHTSGIPEWLTRDLFENRVEGVPEFFRSRHTPTQILAAMPSRTPAFDPGSKQQYSNTNGLLVGEIIREASGKKLGDIFDEFIVEPLALTHTYLYGEATIDRPRARGYSDFESTDGAYFDCSFADEALPDSADGSVVASVGDLVRYHRALRNGELLSERSWKEMNTVDPGNHNGLAYLIGEGPFGPYAGNVGRAMGHVAFNVYYADHDLYVAVLLNHAESQLSLDQLVGPWLEQ
jgi:D-alanyl-D-alanine carboxypeptidase